MAASIEAGDCRHRDLLMYRLIILALGALCLVATCGAPVLSQELFAAHAENLNGAAVTLPAGLGAERTVLLVGFHHGEQPVMDAWRDGLRLEGSASNWLEAPVIGPVNPVVQSMIRTGMRGRFHTSAQRAHVIPIFETPETIALALGVSRDGVSAVVVDRAGRVLAHESGAYSAKKGASILQALQGTP